MITKMLNVVNDNKDDLNDNNVNSCILAAVDDKKDNLNHNKDNIDDNKDSLNDNNANSCILAGLINPPFTLILSLLGKAASSIVFLTGFSIFKFRSVFIVKIQTPHHQCTCTRRKSTPPK